MKRIAIAVVEHEGRFLIGRRPASVPLAGYWEFPGGKVRPDESPQQAAIRECREETGLDVSLAGEYPLVRHVYEHGELELHFFAARTIEPSQSPQPPFIWVDRSELATREFPPANAAILAVVSDAVWKPPNGH